MIHIVTRDNAAEYTDQLEEMYRWRHRIYVEERGWKEIARPDGREIDQFDTEDAVYLIAIDDAGEFAGSTRLNPTHRPNMLSDVFPHLVLRGKLPNSPKIWDWTRMFVVPAMRREAGRCPTLEKLFASVMELAIKEDLDALVTLAEVHWLTRLLKMGWIVDPLGLPSLIEGEFWVPFQCKVSAHILDATRQSFQLPDTTLFANRPSLNLAS